MKKFNHTDEAKNKMSMQRKGSLNAFYNKKHTDEAKRKISKANKKSKDYYIEKFLEAHGNLYDYSLIEEDISSISRVKIICPKHGVFEQKVYSHYSGYGCKYCRDDLKRNKIEDLIPMWEEVHENKYDYSLVEYKNNSTKIKIICPKHGVFEQRPADHAIGNGCPSCRHSKGEKEIKKFLERKSVNFEPQKRFDKCYNKNKLPFDFYLIDYNILIEYDGEQHFKPKYMWGGEEAFRKIKENERIKNEFAEKNGIKLIRIGYKEKKNIPYILEDLIESNKRSK